MDQAWVHGSEINAQRVPQGSILGTRYFIFILVLVRLSRLLGILVVRSCSKKKTKKTNLTKSNQTLWSDVRSTSWKGAGSILQLLKLTCSSSCISSHSAICKTTQRREERQKNFPFPRDTNPESRLDSRLVMRQWAEHHPTTPLEKKPHPTLIDNHWTGRRLG